MNQNYRLRSWMVAICSVVIVTSAAPSCVACSWDYPIWMIRSKSADPFYRFTRDGKAGYIDGGGRIIIEPKLDFFSNKDGEFHDGLLLTNMFDGRFTNTFGKVAVDNIDKKGQIVIEPKFDDANLFSEGFALVQQGRLAGFIDRTGAFVIPAQFEYAEDFSDGLAVVGFSIISFKENKGHIDRAFWYINKEGKQAIPEAFDLASSFVKGLAHVRLKSHKKDENAESSEPGPFAYINTTGETVFTY
jgi:hypothetical protein